MRWMAMAAAALLATTGPADARDLSAKAGKDWKHDASGLVLRPTLAGLPRVALTDSTAGEWDVAAQFNDPDIRESATVYIFRAATPDVAIWFDRAEYALAHRPGYGGVRPAGPATAFAPPGGSVASGLRRVFAPANGPYKSAGVALLPIGEWLVTIRLSSTTLDPAALDTRFASVLAELGWPRVKAPATAATPVAACPTPLAFRPATLQKPDMGQAVLGSMLASAVLDGKAKPTADAPLPWCREGEQTGIWGAYRRASASDGYVLALGDAGKTAGVYPGMKLPTMPGSGGYSVTLTDVDGSVAGYPAFDAMPRPEQVLAMIQTSQPMTRTARGPNGKVQVNVNGDMFK